jgi:hypothetical protein
MSYAEMEKIIDEFIAEYFGLKSDGTLNSKKITTDSEMRGYRERLKDFFDKNDVPKKLDFKFRSSGVGESYYMANGHGILELNR